MTRKEFTSKSEVLGRIVGLCVPGFLILVFCLTFVGQFLSAYIERHYHTTRWDTPGAILLMAFLFGGMAGIVYLERHLARKWGLICPHCGRRFIEDRYRYRVLLKGECGKCKNNVFDDQMLAGSTPSHTLDREEFKVKHESFTRQATRKAICLLMLFLAAGISIRPGAVYFRRLVDDGRLDWVTLTQWRWFVGLMLGTLCLSFFSVAILAALGKFKLRCLPCPECGRSLVGGAGRFALDKGICMYCGCRLFETLPAVSK